MTEMLVAMMLLTIGALALYHSMGASNALAETSDRRSTGTQLMASELEKARTLPYTAVAMKTATAGTTYFEGAIQVTDASDGQVLPSSSIAVDGVTYDVSRYVTWRNATVNGTTVAQAFKQITVVVSWTDERGTHDVRSASAISRTSAPSLRQNLALGGTASMSSLFSSSFPAEKLIDGNTYGAADYTANMSIGHTLQQTNPWAAITLPASSMINEISIWNRTDCCASRATNVWVFVSESPISNDLSVAKSSGATALNIPGEVGRPSTLPVNRTGRYVKVFIERSSEYLNLAEIEIIGVQP